jgi:hypothetical protein
VDARASDDARRGRRTLLGYCSSASDGVACERLNVVVTRGGVGPLYMSDGQCLTCFTLSGCSLDRVGREHRMALCASDGPRPTTRPGLHVHSNGWLFKSRLWQQSNG